jgi:hypothetical protein
MRISIPNDVDVEFLQALARRYIGLACGIAYPNDDRSQPASEFVYDEELTPAQQATFAKLVEKSRAVILFDNLPYWATWTGDEAAAYVNDNILLGQTQAQLETWIDAQVADLTTANLAQINARMAAIRTALKTIVVGLITTRTILSALARAIMYLREAIIRGV